MLIGTVGLSQALGWYFDPLREVDRTTAIVAATRPPARPARGQVLRPLPPATREELALLTAAAPALQRTGAEALLARVVTPDVVAAVDAALARSPDPPVRMLLVCIKSRFEGPDSLEFMLGRFPTARRELGWTLPADVACILDGLVERITDAPERITAALMPAIYAGNGATRQKVLGAFRLVDLPSIPAALLAEAATPGGADRRDALAAALALGALRHHPSLVETAIGDSSLIAVVKEDLRSDPHPNGARIVARAWARQPSHPDYEQLARAREALLHDVSAALLELVRASAEPEARRAAAARGLATLAEVGALRDLRAESALLPAGALKTAVDATIEVLQHRRAAGGRDQMRVLPQ